MILTWAALILGLLLIVKGGDLFVDQAVWMARVSGVPPFLIGATVVSLATTMPEFLVSVMAAFRGQNQMACGNAVGSVIANTSLILSIALLALPGRVSRRQYLAKGLLLIGTVLVLLASTRQGELAGWGSLALLGIFLLFMGENIWQARQALDGRKEKSPPPSGGELGKHLVLFGVGTLGLVAGARLLVGSATRLALLLGVSQGVVAATIVALGTSLPELVTTLTAVAKKQASLSAGNILGANIIDNALILPACGLVSGGALPISLQTRLIDLPFCLVGLGVVLVPMVLLGRFYRWQGALGLGVYLAYLFLLIR